MIIDCITPVFLEPSTDPIQFLGSLLSFQSIPSHFSCTNSLSIFCHPLTSYRHHPSIQFSPLSITPTSPIAHLNDCPHSFLVRSSQTENGSRIPGSSRSNRTRPSYRWCHIYSWLKFITAHDHFCRIQKEIWPYHYGELYFGYAFWQDRYPQCSG